LDDWRQVAVLSIGGAAGVNARHWLGMAIARWASPRFPWGTVAINASGSFAIGVLAVVLARRWPDPLARLGVVTGFLGGYTTFSAFAFESFTLWERGDRPLAAANAVGSVALGLAAVTLGVALGRALVGPEADGQAGAVVERPATAGLSPGPRPRGEEFHP